MAPVCFVRSTPPYRRHVKFPPLRMKQLFIWKFYTHIHTHSQSTNPNFIKISPEYRKLEEVQAFVRADRPKLVKYISQLKVFLTIAPEEQMKTAGSSETSE
jgi:hypothetical protein